jgi:hypothetical protein
MKKLTVVAALAVLTACDSQEVEQPQAVQTATPAVTDTGSSLPPPRTAVFAEVWAEACPDAQPVSTALCRSKGFADPNFVCNFGLGDDEDRRHTAELAPGNGSWTLAEPATACGTE